MKIEGMLSPLPVTRILTRGSESADSAGSSEDAVYFEPDDKRRQNKEQDNKEQSASDSPKQELAAHLDVRLIVDSEKTSTAELSAIDTTSAKKSLARIIDVLA